MRVLVVDPQVILFGEEGASLLAYWNLLNIVRYVEETRYHVLLLGQALR